MTIYLKNAVGHVTDVDDVAKGVAQNLPEPVLTKVSFVSFLKP